MGLASFQQVALRDIWFELGFHLEQPYMPSEYYVVSSEETEAHLEEFVGVPHSRSHALQMHI